VIQSVDRALDLLEALGEAEELRLSQLAARAGLTLSTTHRLLATLMARGYVAQHSDGGPYELSYRALTVAAPAARRTTALRATARACLERIRKVSGETANLAVFAGHRVGACSR